jgi:hypothetical protein
VKPGAPAAGDDPIVRTRVEKYGGAIATDLAMAGDPLVKPPAGVTGPAVAKKPQRQLTLDFLIEQYKENAELRTYRVLRLGCLTDRYIREQSDRPANEKLDRASCVRVIRRRLAEEHVEKEDARVDLYIRCYQAARLLSGWGLRDGDCKEAEGLSYSVVRLFPVLCERDRSSEAWRILPATAAAAKALWGRAVQEHLSAAAVDAAISQILPERDSPAKQPARSRQAQTVLRILPHLSVEELTEIIRAAREERSKVKDAPAPAMAG